MPAAVGAQAFLPLNAARRLIWRSALVAVSERGGDAHPPCCGGTLVGEKAGEGGARE